MCIAIKLMFRQRIYYTRHWYVVLEPTHSPVRVQKVKRVLNGRRACDLSLSPDCFVTVRYTFFFLYPFIARPGN